MHKKKVISWTLYDWGNSAFATTVMAGFFPIFFEKYWSDPEFVDESTVFMLRSRPNQANGSVQFINEVDQSTLSTGGGSIHHNEAKNIFSIDANTANVSVSSGGSGTY